jgi:hypothetical protein
MRSVVTVLLFLVSATPAAAKSYSAERFDAHIRVLPGGNIEVTETVVFRFADGTFQHVFREIPTRRTDGVEVVRATMDGRVLPFGGGTDEVEVRHGSPVRVQWRFGPRSGTSHVFVLNYLVRGVVRQERDRDVLEWVALPAKHDYQIAASHVFVEAPAPLAGAPDIDTRRVESFEVEPASAQVEVISRQIRRNGWVRTRLSFAGGAVLAAAPLWQQRQQHTAALAPRWGAAAMIVFAAGLGLLLVARQRYAGPPHDPGVPSQTYNAPPDRLRPALAGALSSNGSVSLQHAMATFFALADRGAVAVIEEPKRWGQRRFVVHRKDAAGALTPEETVLLELAFRSSDRQEEIPLTKAHTSIQSGMHKFRTVVRNELNAQGLIDHDRMQVRSTLSRWSLLLLLLAIALAVVGALTVRQFGGWPLLIPAALGAAALVGSILSTTVTPLSNEGFRRAKEWRAYGRYLKDVTRDRVAFQDSLASILPFAVALGLAGAWATLVKRFPDAIPPWFRGIAAADDGAYAAFIATGGAGDGGAGAAGAGGAAGGGASGAG